MVSLSFMGANFVAREDGYTNRDGWSWMDHDKLTQERFRPLATFRERISPLLDEVVTGGFELLDLWVAHLHPSWATPEHVAIFQQEIEARKLRIASLAGGFGDHPAEFRAACRLAALLNIPVLGGGTPLLATHRSEMVAELREFGLIFALENHPEPTPSVLLEKLGSGDEDVMKVALDTGWFGTQGYPADQAIRELAGRLGHVHLKDVLARGAHDTCAFGAGVVPIADCIAALKEAGYRGAISIEHEPFDRDPAAEVASSRVFALDALGRVIVTTGQFRPVGMAILGCGNISAAYARQIGSYPEATLLGACDLDPARAAEFAAKFGCRAYPTIDEMLADPDVEVVVNLTIHHAHRETTERCLRAGKHVHTEKPLATTPQGARELVDIARECGLRLSSAPVTWMGEAQATAWAALDSGAIGTPRVAYAEVNWGRIESWHPNPAPFYDVGPVFDVAVYPITLLTAWFGPVREVVAGGGILHPDRHTNDGAPFRVGSEDWTSAVLRFESGLFARLTSSFYVSAANSQSGLEIHGDLGSIRMGRWDVSNTWVEHGKFGGPMRRLPVLRPGSPGIEYASGVRDLAIALREGRAHRCTGEQAAHVVEVCEAILKASRQGTAICVESGFPAPAQPDWAGGVSKTLRAAL